MDQTINKIVTPMNSNTVPPGDVSKNTEEGANDGLKGNIFSYTSIQ